MHGNYVYLVENLYSITYMKPFRELRMYETLTSKMDKNYIYEFISQKFGPCYPVEIIT